MSEQTTSPAEESQDNNENPLDELNMLKDRARTMGIKVGNIGIDTLKKRIQDKLDGKADEDEGETQPKASSANKSDARPMSKREREQRIREDLQKEYLALVRCRIYNLNPGKRDLQGEIITVANRFIGTVRKFIPFGEQTDNGYHIPRIIFEDLKSRKFQQIRTKANQGQIDVKTRMVPEYNIEVLPPLTKEELQELALKQSAAERLGAE